MYSIYNLFVKQLIRLVNYRCQKPLYVYAMPWGSRYYFIFFRDSIEVDKFESEKGETLQ